MNPTTSARSRAALINILRASPEVSFQTACQQLQKIFGPFLEPEEVIDEAIRSGIVNQRQSIADDVTSPVLLQLGDYCSCKNKGKFMDAEDYRDHLPCPGSDLEQLEANRQLRKSQSDVGLLKIEDILYNVTFAPSNIAMGWEWEVVSANYWEKARWVELWEKALDGLGTDTQHDGFLIRTTFQRPDRETGVVTKGYGGWHFIPGDATEDAIVKRAFVAAEAIVRHELMEAFRYQGVRVFDPHHDIDDLRAAATNRSQKLV